MKSLVTCCNLTYKNVIVRSLNKDYQLYNEYYMQKAHFTDDSNIPPSDSKQKERTRERMHEGSIERETLNIRFVSADLNYSTLSVELVC